MPVVSGMLSQLDRKVVCTERRDSNSLSFSVALFYIQCNLTSTSHIINLLETILKNSDEGTRRKENNQCWCDYQNPLLFDKSIIYDRVPSLVSQLILLNPICGLKVESDSKR